jgi:hypothetical protein
MLVRATRWFLITAPVVAGILVLIFGTAGSISISFGIVLIGIGFVIWMWNWFVRMSFDENDDAKNAPGREQQGREEHAPQRLHREAAPGHPRRKLTRTPRRRS